jgi:hypothetical protein
VRLERTGALALAWITRSGWPGGRQRDLVEQDELALGGQGGGEGAGGDQARRLCILQHEDQALRWIVGIQRQVGRPGLEDTQ